jgi:hypothetical protein
LRIKEQETRLTLQEHDDDDDDDDDEIYIFRDKSKGEGNDVWCTFKYRIITFLLRKEEFFGRSRLLWNPRER